MNDTGRNGWWQRAARYVSSEWQHSPLGAVYYVFGILAFAFGAVKALMAFWDDRYPERITYLNYSLIAIGVCIALVVPFLVQRVVRQRNAATPALNADFDSLRVFMELAIKPTNRIVKRRDTVQARSTTRTLIYRFRPTGNVSLSVRLEEPKTAVLSGPVHYHEYVVYQVAFARPLTAGQTAEVALWYEVQDPERTMKPYHSLTLSNYHSCREIAHHLRFPDQHPRSVMHEVIDARTRAAGGPITTLFPNPSGEYTHQVDSASTSRCYNYSWNW